MSNISFKAKLYKIGSWTILRLPESASKKLQSRGMVMVKGTINGFPFKSVLEPDGRGSHWLKVDETMRSGAHTDTGDTVTLSINPSGEWPEPVVPEDLKKALTGLPQAQKLWMDITPMARWDWIRWIRATKNPATRKHRIELTLSKFKDGKRRPCCFNRTQCTEPYVAHNGMLPDPFQATK